VVADDPLVVHPGGGIEFMLPEMAIQQCAECRLGPSYLQRVGFALKTSQGLLGVLPRSPFDRSFPGFSIRTDSTSTRRSPVAGSVPADTRTCRRSPRRRILPRFRPPLSTLAPAICRTLASVVDRTVDEDQPVAVSKVDDIHSKSEEPPANRGFLAVSTVRAPEGIRTPNLLII
jgi:hypothetical protein